MTATILEAKSKTPMTEFTSTQHTGTPPLEFFEWLIAHLQRFEFAIVLLAPLAFHENMFDFIRTGYIWIYQFNLWFQSKNIQKCRTKSLFSIILQVNRKGKPIQFLFIKIWHKALRVNSWWERFFIPIRALFWIYFNSI